MDLQVILLGKRKRSENEEVQEYGTRNRVIYAWAVWKHPKKVKEERTRDCSKNLRRLVHRGEMPIELGDSWFSAKAIKVARFPKGV